MTRQRIISFSVSAKAQYAALAAAVRANDIQPGWTDAACFLTLTAIEPTLVPANTSGTAIASICALINSINAQIDTISTAIAANQAPINTISAAIAANHAAIETNAAAVKYFVRARAPCG